MYFLYNFALWLATPLLLLWAAYRALRGRLPGLSQRLGFLSWKGFTGDGPVVWFHAVSLGEVKAAAALIEELRTRLPDLRVVMTSSTRTGWSAARQLLPAPCPVLFPPWDYRSVCRRFLRRIRPNIVVVVETELWPNLFRECKRFGADLLIVNGRISDKTFPRYLATRPLWRQVLGWADSIFVQSSGDAQRFQALGAPREKIRAAGNLKFASRPARSPLVDSLLEAVRDGRMGPVIVAGSTMPGEEKYLLGAYQELLPEFPGLWLILAPRHPERFSEVREQVQSLGLPFQLWTQWTRYTTPSAPGVLILDTMGELGAMYELATVAYVGGTLVPTGGHNILEPAYFARPIVVGPSVANFQEIASDFLQDSGAGQVPGGRARTGAIIQIPDAASLAPVFRFLLHNSPFRRRLGEAARDRYKRNFSGLSSVVDELERLLIQQRADHTRAESAQQREVVAGEME